MVALKKEDLVCIIVLPLFDLPLVLRHLFVHSFWITICLNQAKLSHEFNLTFKSTKNYSFELIHMSFPKFRLAVCSRDVAVH